MSFEKLLGDLQELQDLQKAQAPAAVAEDDDEKVAAAAADSGVDTQAEQPGGDATEPDGDEGAGAGDGDGDEEPMGKSFEFVGEDGQKHEAVDGTELVKSLMAKIDTQESSMTKALGVAVDLIKSQGDLLKSQGEQIADLTGRIERLSNEGRGRKATVSVAEKPAAGELQKSEPAGVSGQEFMTKALAAQADGKLTGRDVAIAETSLQKGLAVPADIVKRVLG